jgi:hypothetical protein
MKIDTDTDEGKAELQKRIDAATEGLKAKNAELLGDVKKQKDGLKDIQTQLDEIKAAKEAAEEAAAAKSGDVTKIKEQLEAKHAKETKALKDALAGKEGTLNKLLIDNGLTEALTKAGVAPQYLDAAKALIQSKNKAEIVDVDGNAAAQIDGKNIAEFVTAWSQGDNGKHFVAAPQNGGGGAKGTDGVGKALGEQKRSEMNHEKKAEFIKEHGQEAYLKLPA